MLAMSTCRIDTEVPSITSMNGRTSGDVSVADAASRARGDAGPPTLDLAAASDYVTADRHCRC